MRLLSRFRIWLRHQIIHGQFMTVTSLVPPSFEGTVNFSTLRWHEGDAVARNSLQAAGQSGFHRMHQPDSRSRNIHRVGRMSDDAFYERDRDRTRHVQIDCLPCRHDFRRRAGIC